MGYYSEYLKQQLRPDQLEKMRSEQLTRIGEIRGRDVLVMGADLTKGSKLPISIDYGDLIAVTDQLSNLTGKALDLILETPGGAGEIAEDIVRLLRSKYENLGVIVPGAAKSAGTIIAMAADELLMEPVSALGPIDAQIAWQGKVFSAGALLEQVDKIKKEVQATGVLNKAYIPILQALSPGELQHAENALEFAKTLVSEWLVKYKFRDWHKRESSGEVVTDQFRRDRAREIADALCDHNRWMTHGRSIHIDQLRALKLLVTDYTEQTALCEAIQRYRALLALSFRSNMFKLIETPQSRVVRLENPQRAVSPIQASPQPAGVVAAAGAEVHVTCKTCGTKTTVAARFSSKAPIPPGSRTWPAGDKFECPQCKAPHDLKPTRQQLESQLSRRIY